jgi:Tfp pilus assembly protein FimT
LAALSIPMLNSSMQSMQLISDARSIATTMTYAKLRAVSQMTQYRLSFDLNDDEWSLQKWNRETEEWELEQDTNVLSRGVATNEVAFKSESDTAPTGFPTDADTDITFNSRGVPIGGVGIVYLANEEEDYAVSASLSGKIQVWRYRDEEWVSQ